MNRAVGVDSIGDLGTEASIVALLRVKNSRRNQNLGRVNGLMNDYGGPKSIITSGIPIVEANTSVSPEPFLATVSLQVRTSTIRSLLSKAFLGTVQVTVAALPAFVRRAMSGGLETARVVELCSD